LKEKKTFIKILLFASSEKFSGIANIILLPILLTKLSYEDYGIWGIILGVKNFCAAFRYLGTAPILTRSFFKNKSTYLSVWKHVSYILQKYVPIYLIAVSIIYWLVLPELRGVNKYWIIILCLIPDLIYGNICQLGKFSLRFQYKYKNIALINCVSTVTYCITSVIAVYKFNSGIIGVILASTLSSVINNILYGQHIKNEIKKNKTNIKINTVKVIFHKSVCHMPYKISTQFGNVTDKFAMVFCGIPEYYIGIYTLGQTISGLFNILLTGYQYLTLKHWFRLLKSKHFTTYIKKINSTQNKLTTLVICIFVFIVYGNRLLASTKYELPIIITGWLVLNYCFKIHTLSYTTLATYFIKTKEMSFAACFTSLFKFMAMIIFGTYFDFVGILVCSVIFSCLSPYIGLSFTEKNTDIKTLPFKVNIFNQMVLTLFCIYFALHKLYIL
jgi:hypothetical protein